MSVEFHTEHLTRDDIVCGTKSQRKSSKQLKPQISAMIEMNAGGKFVQIKEERGLMEILIVIPRSRPQFDLKECIGTYEFGVVLRSLFASDVTVFLAYDKAKILHHIELLVINEITGHAHSSHGNIHEYCL